MNSCILMAEVVQDPQLRYTSESQLAVAEMWVEFEGIRDEDPRERLKVVGWGNLAQEIQETYKIGDRIIIEGRLGMNTIDRPEGFKEKRAEMTAQRIYRLGADGGAVLTASTASGSSSSTSAPAKTESQPAKAKPARTSRPNASEAPPAPAYPAAPTPSPETPDYDDIPF
jgi:single-strand DNA-binding protein